MSLAPEHNDTPPARQNTPSKPVTTVPSARVPAIADTTTQALMKQLIEDRNHFAAAFTAYHERAKLNLRKIAAAAGISAGDLSRIRAGKKRATAETLAKLVLTMSPADGAALTVAFLKDAKPPSMEKLVHITTAAKGTGPGQLSRYQQAIQTLADLEDNPALRRHIISTAETLAHLLTKPRK